MIERYRMGRIAYHKSARSRTSLHFETLEPRQMLAVVISEIAGGDSDFLATRVRPDAETPFTGAEITPGWIELHNTGAVPVDLGGHHLTDDALRPSRWQFPAGVLLPAGGFLVVFASGANVVDMNLDESGRYHTDFSLQNSGEYLGLTGESGQVVFEYAPEFARLYEGYSYGLNAQGEPAYFGHATPGAPNDDSSIVPGFVADTRFSVDRGFFDAPITVDVTTDTLGATVVYTTDSSVPSLTNGTRVLAPDASTVPVATISIETTTVLRARAFYEDWVPTNVDTQTYLYLEYVVAQPAWPHGFPTSWGGAPVADYGMDPEIVDDPDYASDLMEGLRDLPTLSVSAPVGDVFGPSGIYSNTTADLEVEASAELIFGDGTTGFQEEAGFMIQGGASRNPNNSPKHSLSLRFRDTIGNGKLEFPLYDDSPVTKFDSVHLRAMYNNSWIHWSSEQRARGTLIRDQWMRDSMLEMGQIDAGRGRYAHLYINGLYWGVHILEERPEASHYAQYFGGDEGDYDALNGGRAVDGNLSSYQAMKAIVQTGDWQAIQQVLDVDNYIDWTIMQRFGGNRDLKSDGNWRAAGGGPRNAPWRFYLWDAERVLESVDSGAPVPVSDPIEILSSLNQIEEFRVRFADRIQRHFFQDGALTPSRTSQRWANRVDELHDAIVAESARWGDYRRDAHPRNCGCDLYDRDHYWQIEVDRLVNDYFPFRTSVVLAQYRNEGYFPALSAPAFLIDGVGQHGGEIVAGSSLSFATASDVYYTLDGSDPRQEGGVAVGTLWRAGLSDPIVLTESTIVKARVLSGRTWSPLNTADFLVVPVEGSLVVTEVNYHPHDPTEAETAALPNVEADDFEFIEIANVHPTARINLLGMQFVNGISFAFPHESLAPGERAVVVENMAAFAVRYGDGIRILGQWSGGLSNSGETLQWVDGLGADFWKLEYSDVDLWPRSADGAGATLVWQGEFTGEALPANKHYHWVGSSEFGGSPGAASMPRPSVVINEVLTYSGTQPDAIELFNRGSQPIDIGGWFLSDSRYELLKYEIPAGTVLAAGGYRVFDESHFNPTPQNPAPTHFALNGTEGDDVWLTVADGAGRVATFVDEIHFGAAFEDQTLGRVPNGTGRLLPLARNSLGCRNSSWQASDVVITEIQYRPASPNAAAVALDPAITLHDLEFVEITNASLAMIDVGRGRLSGGVELELPLGTHLDAGESLLLVPIDPEDSLRLQAFRAHYELGPGVRIAGGVNGRLENNGEAMRWEQAELPRPSAPTFVPYVVVDEVVYDDLPPWEGIDGSGPSLQRRAGVFQGHDAASWVAQTPTPGVAFLGLPNPGDLTGDRVVDAADIDALYAAVGRGRSLAELDLNGDAVVDGRDVSYLVETILETRFGDANLDGQVDVSDFNQWNSHKFSACAGSWARGDFSGDGQIDVSDFNLWNANKFLPAAQAIPLRTEWAARPSPVRSVRPMASHLRGGVGDGTPSASEGAAPVGLRHDRGSHRVAARTLSRATTALEGVREGRPKQLPAGRQGEDLSEVGEFLKNFPLNH